MKKMRDLSTLEQGKWYAIAVGEVGIPPTEFYDMTMEELEWAFNGYKQRQEDIANIVLSAINRSQTNQRKTLFQFVERKGYDIGNLDERQQTFITLGIKEE